MQQCCEGLFEAVFEGMVSIWLEDDCFLFFVGTPSEILMRFAHIIIRMMNHNSFGVYCSISWNINDMLFEIFLGVDVRIIGGGFMSQLILVTNCYLYHIIWEPHYIFMKQIKRGVAIRVAISDIEQAFDEMSTALIYLHFEKSEAFIISKTHGAQNIGQLIGSSWSLYFIDLGGQDSSHLPLIRAI
ncbi:hypothetical protein ACJX0J_019201, partial [Zea mays]